MGVFILESMKYCLSRSVHSATCFPLITDMFSHLALNFVKNTIF